MLETNDLEIKYSSGEMDHLEEQVYLSKLSSSELARVQDLKAVFSDLRSLRHDVPPMQFSAERLKLAIDNSEVKKLPSASWFKLNRMWMPVAAALVLAGFLVYSNEPKAPEAAVAYVPGAASGKGLVATGGPERGVENGETRRQRPRVRPSIEQKNSGVSSDAPKPASEVASSNAGEPKVAPTNPCDSLKAARREFNKPNRRKNNGMVAKLESNSFRTKGVKNRPGSARNSGLSTASLAADTVQAIENSMPGATGTAGPGGSEEVRVGGNQFGSTLKPSISKPEIIIIVNNPEGSDSNEAVEVNHRVNIIIGS